MQHIKQLGVIGYSAYVRGCRCKGEGSCTDAARIAQANRRAKKRSWVAEIAEMDSAAQHKNGATTMTGFEAKAAELAGDRPGLVPALAALLREQGSSLTDDETVAAVNALLGTAAQPSDSGTGETQPAGSMKTFAEERRQLGIDRAGNMGSRRPGFSRATSQGIFDQ